MQITLILEEWSLLMTLAWWQPLVKSGRRGKAGRVEGGSVGTAYRAHILL